jgi:hypothetical protein
MTEPNLDLSAEAAAEGPIAVNATGVVLAPAAPRPDITPAQIVGMIPLLAQFLHAFGVYSLSQAQQDSLTALTAGSIALFGADAIIRLGRNLAHR